MDIKEAIKVIEDEIKCRIIKSPLGDSGVYGDKSEQQKFPVLPFDP